MPLSKRFKDEIKTYQILRAELQNAQQALLLAQANHRKVKEAFNKKVAELLKELSSSVPLDPKGPQERLVEVDGKVFLVNESPRDVSTDIPSYIQEIQVEK